MSHVLEINYLFLSYLILSYRQDTCIRYDADYNISLFSSIIPIETNFVCTQWTVYEISS